MEIEFDPDKDAANRDKHGVSLGFGKKVLTAPEALVFDTMRVEDGEDRHKAVGMIDDRLWTAVYVERTAPVRFISVRKSNEAERRAYHRHPR